MAIPFAMQAQTKFHDVEANEATGAVKCIQSNMMGREQVINFTKEGKMESNGISDAKYDENGYLQSAERGYAGSADRDQVQVGERPYRQPDYQHDG